MADSEKYPLRLSDLVVFDINPELCPEKIVWANSVPMRGVPSFGMAGDMIYEPMWLSEKFVPYQQTVLFVDPAGRGSDETAVCVASFAHGYIFVHELIGLDGGYDKAVLMKIAKIAYQYGIKLIRVESNWGDAMFCQLLRPVVAEICGKVGIEEYRVKGQKEARMISLLEPVLAAHRLCIDTRAIRQEETQKQLTRLHGARGALPHDDRIDVLSAAVGYWEENMGVNIDNVIEKNRAKEHASIIKDWMDDKRRVRSIAGDQLSGALRFRDDESININRRFGR